MAITLHRFCWLSLPCITTHAHYLLCNSACDIFSVGRSTLSWQEDEKQFFVMHPVGLLCSETKSNSRYFKILKCLLINYTISLQEPHAALGIE